MGKRWRGQRDVPRLLPSPTPPARPCLPLPARAGHGTHAAATIGGLTYGVAKNVSLWAVRAMNCDGDAKVSAILEVGGVV